MSAQPWPPTPAHTADGGAPSAILTAVPTGAHSTGTVHARGVTRRYGEGDTTVHALRDVSVDIEAAQPH